MPAKTRRASISSTPPHRAGSGGWRHLLWFPLLIAVVVAIFYFTELEWRQVPEMMQRVSPALALLMMATLPLIGFPVSAVYLAAGVIFGPWVGLLVITAVTATHLVVTQLLATSVLRGPIERLRKKWSHRIPEVPASEQAALVAMIVIVPGPPYVARNGLLALSEVPWRTLFSVALPLYVVRSGATIFLGDVGNNPSRTALAILAGIYALKLTATYFLFRRLRRTVHRKKSRVRVR